MPSRKALSDIERNPRLKKAWIAYLEKKGLDRAYELAMTCKDVRTYKVQFIDRMTAGEKKRFGTLRPPFITSYNASKGKAEKQFESKYKVDTAEAAGMVESNRKYADEYEALILAQPQMAKTMKDGTQAILSILNTLADTTHASGFKASNQHAAFMKGAINPKKVGAAMDLLEFQVDDILAMSVAVAAEDTQQVNRLSNQIANNHKPKKGGKLTAKDIKTAAYKAMKKMKLL